MSALMYLEPLSMALESLWLIHATAMDGMLDCTHRIALYPLVPKPILILLTFLLSLSFFIPSQFIVLCIKLM